MAWKIEFEKQALKEFAKIDSAAQKKIISYLDERIATQDDPRMFGEPLRSKLAGLWRYRVGDYRIVVEIHDNKLVVLVVRNWATE